MKACFNCDTPARDSCFSPESIAEVQKRFDLNPDAPAKVTKEWLLERVKGCEAVIAGWGSVPMDAGILDACPDLKVVFNSAGSIKPFETPELWKRGIKVTSAANMNGIPVAEFLMGQVIMGMKDVFDYRRRFVERGPAVWNESRAGMPGFYKSTVGIIGMGNVGKHFLKLTQAFRFRVLVHSFYPFEKQAAEAGAQIAGIDTIMRESDAVVVAAPNIPEYHHMFDARRFALMKTGAWFYNSARGALVDESALLPELISGRIKACLDVTDPEPPVAGSPLYTLPNVVLTPHIAGSVGRECLCLGDQVLAEIDHFLKGEPFENEITEELARMIG